MNGPFGTPLPHAPGLGVPFPAMPIPQELVRLYYTIESLGPERAPGVLQLVAASEGEGTSTIAGMLARVAAGRQGQSVLLLACGGPAAASGCSTAEAIRAGLPLKQSAAVLAADGTYWRARLAPAPADEWRDIFAAVRKEFDITFIDCPAASTAADALALARHCDGTVLVVRAEASTAAAVQGLRRDIERVGGRVVGAVFNRERRHVPGWLRRWL